jgi:hypothetical protein
MKITGDPIFQDRIFQHFWFMPLFEELEEKFSADLYCIVKRRKEPVKDLGPTLKELSEAKSDKSLFEQIRFPNQSTEEESSSD